MKHVPLLLSLSLLSCCAAGQKPLPPVVVPPPVLAPMPPPMVVLLPAHRTHRGVRALGHHPGMQMRLLHPAPASSAVAAPTPDADTPEVIDSVTDDLTHAAAAEVTKPTSTASRINALTIATARTHRAVEELHQHEAGSGRARAEDIAAVRAEAEALGALVHEMQTTQAEPAR